MVVGGGACSFVRQGRGACSHARTQTQHTHSHHITHTYTHNTAPSSASNPPYHTEPDREAAFQTSTPCPLPSFLGLAVRRRGLPLNDAHARDRPIPPSTHQSSRSHGDQGSLGRHARRRGRAPTDDHQGARRPRRQGLDRVLQGREGRGVQADDQDQDRQGREEGVQGEALCFWVAAHHRFSRRARAPAWWREPSRR